MRKISIVVPFHWMQNWQFFLTRCLESIEKQSFKDYEVILIKCGNMPETTNRVMASAQGELIKVLYMDDYFAHEDSLKDIVEAFNGHWLITATDNNPNPYYTQDIHTGNNRLGSPSALTVKNEDLMFFDEDMSWMLDVDYYKRMYEKYGEPVILKKINVNIGIGPHQMTNLLTTDEKELEANIIMNRYE